MLLFTKSINWHTYKASYTVLKDIQYCPSGVHYVGMDNDNAFMR